ncbi:MAG: CopG family transcriptional regulator [Candidatus Binatus sp.]|uniref:ribbon-helix-helix domain-containing protein n=1 Tax=Candidatus Binatus sp. TaxID=2811406 RepID=UPI002719589A|nr:CopG family transcriptional regulator [Candidatus Binatus sp.]MDO8434363.1 CopG family transcriptional regulator [Candidatus Binatus sp.]
MKRDVVTVRLDSDLKPLLEKAVRRSGRTRSEIVREALRRHLLILQFEQIRNRVMPLAEARGYLIDEDIFKDVS